jgi:predicted dehydrogenase
VRLGLVGAGRWGKRYVATIAQMEGVQLAHLASGNPASATLVPPGCTLSSDWRAVAADRSLDGIILATPPATHLEMALAAVAHGLPVLVEKPMTLSVEDACTLVDRARRAGVLVMVGHTHLYSAAFRTLKSCGARLGELLHTRSGGGNWGPFRPETPVLWDWGPHDVAMCLELFSATPTGVEARRVAVEKSEEGTGEAIEIALDFGTGRRAQIRVGNLERTKQRYFEATFARGTLVYDDLVDQKLVYRAERGAATEAVPLDGSMPLTNEVSEFCRLIASAQRADRSLDLGLRVVQVLASCQSRLDLAGEATEAR